MTPFKWAIMLYMMILTVSRAPFTMLLPLPAILAFTAYFTYDTVFLREHKLQQHNTATAPHSSTLTRGGDIYI